MKKQELLDKVRDMIGFDADASLVMNVLENTIPSDEVQAFMEGVTGRRVEKAIRLYQRFNPERGLEVPTVEQLISWLQSVGGSEYINRLEERLARVNELVMAIGPIELDESTAVHNMVVLELRCLSYIDPEATPSRLRKLRRSRVRTV
jgi:hypothetical protein